MSAASPPLGQRPKNPPHDSADNPNGNRDLEQQNDHKGKRAGLRGGGFRIGIGGGRRFGFRVLDGGGGRILRRGVGGRQNE